MIALYHCPRWSVLTVVGMLAMALALTRSSPAAAKEKNAYQQTNLVSDIPGLAVHTDPNLVNAWGIAAGPVTPALPMGTPFWVSDNGTGVTTLYNGAGEPFPVGAPLVVTIPPAASAPTGQVFNGTADFGVASGGRSGPSIFIFVTEDGAISGWNPCVPPPSPPDVCFLDGGSFLSPTAILAVDNSASGAIYKGVAIGSTPAGNFLYAANFHAGTIDVFDNAFQAASLAGSFSDPDLPAGFAPFNIQNLAGQLYVTYAKQDADKEDEVTGQGLGFVDVFDTNGHFLQRVATRGQLNAPWGLTFAPADFGRFSNDLLVGNFGDGRINAYSQQGGHFHFAGQLRGPAGQRLMIDGLWALTFGSGGANNGPTNVLFFTAGPDEEQHGLFGSISACHTGGCSETP